MGLLYPLMALGLIVAAVPIWLHLRRKEETNLVLFSTLRFLDDQPLARARPLWPHHWPLLLLRLAALLSLLAAFMWPYFKNSETVVVQESRVYVLDNTLSHQVDNGFETARDQIADELAQQDVRTQIGVIELSSTARTIVRFGDDQTTSAEAVRGLEPSSERGPYIDAFRAAGEMLATSLGAKRRILLLSDSQANQWTQGSDSPPFLEGIEVDLPGITESVRANRSLAEPRARRVFRDGKHLVEVAVSFINRGFLAPTTALFRDRGREVSRQEVVLSESESEQVRSLFAEWECEPSDWVVGEIAIDGDADALAGDDRVVFSLPPLRTGRVEVIANSLFVRQAFSPDVMRGRWDVTLVDAEQLTPRETGQAPDVLCLESHALSSPAVRERIRGDLSEGRGVVLWVDQTTPLMTGFLRELGINLETTQNTSTDPATFRYLFLEHPIFAPFQTAQFGDLTEIEFTNYRRLAVREAIPLAFSASGDPLVLEVNHHQGRMLVFAFTFDRQDTNWPIHPTFIPFLDKSLAYVRGQVTTASAFQPGESVAWDLPRGDSSKTILVAQLDPASLDPAIDAPDPILAEVRDGRARFRLPVQPGHYALRDENDRISAILDVNPSPLESELIYDRKPAALLAWQIEEERRQANKKSDPTSAIELTMREALQQHVWWYLLIAAFVAFLAETFYSGRLARGS